MAGARAVEGQREETYGKQHQALCAECEGDHEMRVWKAFSANNPRRAARHERYWNKHEREDDNSLA